HAAQDFQVRRPMFAYVLKRILLMLPTLLGVLLITFVVTQFVPGGHVEQYLAEARRVGGGGDTSAYRGGQGVDPKRIAHTKARYGFNKPPAEPFWQRLAQYTRLDPSHKY